MKRSTNLLPYVLMDTMVIYYRGDCPYCLNISDYLSGYDLSGIRLVWKEKYDENHDLEGLFSPKVYPTLLLFRVSLEGCYRVVEGRITDTKLRFLLSLD